MNVNSQPSERVAVVGAIDPDSYAANTYYSGYIPLKNFTRFAAVVAVGDMAASATVNAKLIGYTDGAGSGAADIAGAAITALTQAGTDADKQAVINLDVDKLAGSGLTHFRLAVITAVDASDVCGIVLGFDPRYAPASDTDVATVDSISSSS